MGHFFPQQIFNSFRGLAFVLYRKQTTRNLNQPNSSNTLIVGWNWVEDDAMVGIAVADDTMVDVVPQLRSLPP